MSGASDPLRRVDPRALAFALEHLLELEMHDAALALAEAVAGFDGRWSAAAELARALRRAHFGTPPGEARTEAPAGVPSIPLEALHVSARLRPHARGRLGSWERTLLRSVLP